MYKYIHMNQCIRILFSDVSKSEIQKQKWHDWSTCAQLASIRSGFPRKACDLQKWLTGNQNSDKACAILSMHHELGSIVKAFSNVLIIEVDGYKYIYHIYTNKIILEHLEYGIFTISKDNDLKSKRLRNLDIFTRCTHSKMVLHHRIGKILRKTPDFSTCHHCRTADLDYVYRSVQRWLSWYPPMWS